MSEETTKNTDNNSLHLEVLLEEYKAIREASLTIDGRIDILRQITVGVFAAIIGFFSTIDWSKSLWLLPAASVIFSTLGLLVSFSLRQSRTLAQYEGRVLRSKIEGLLRTDADEEQTDVLEWQNFFRKEIHGSGWFKRIVSYAQGLSFFLFPTGTSFAFLLVYILNLSLSRSKLLATEVLLLIISIILLVAASTSYIPEINLKSKVI